MKRLQSLSYKTLFAILFFALAGIVFFIKIGGKTEKVSAAWWDDMWHYRKAISITNSSGSNQSNIQVKILENYDLSTLVTAGKIQSDLDDLRFTDINGNLINYWIEDSTPNQADVWGVIPSLPTSGTTIYMYYGNPSATSVSSTSNITIGGTMTSIGGYRIHTFLGNGTLINANNTTAEVLVVGGGGGGGSSTGAGGGGAGGGGAGGLTYNAAYPLTQGQIVNITVGIGGTNGATSSNQAGADGGNSVFGTIIVNGGGGGANTGANGRPGGSGGGGGYNHYSTVRYGGSGIVGIGNSGGNTSNLSYAGGAGGGGAAGVGGDNKVSHVGGDGGLGISYSITGVGTTYSTGGRGGGGAAPVTKTANTGNGGDGSYANSIPTSGSSGIVVIRYTSGTSSSPNTEETGGGPIAYWKFDEGNGSTTYDSAGTNNGTLSGTTLPEWQTEENCISGKCLYFNNTNKVQIPSNASFNTSTMTIEMWLKLTDTGQWFGIYRGASGNNTWYFYADTPNVATFSWFVNGTRYNISAGAPNTNEWHHFAIIISPGLQQTYRDGKLVNTSTIASGLNATDGIIKLGEYTSTGNYNLIGYLDDVKIYPYARTADQILQDYNSRGSLSGSSVNLGIKSNTAPSIKTKIAAHWKLDETNDSTIKDSSGNNFIGTLGSGNSSPTWSTNGKFNSALSFDGNDSITLSNEIVSTSSIRISGITYSVWVKPTTVSGTQKIFGQKPASGYSDLASGGIDISSGKARMIAYDDNIAYKYATGNTTLNPNQWYLITGVYDPTDQKIKIYVNGKFDGGETSITTFSRLLANNYNLVGSHNYASSFFNGLIDEIKIYNKALTPEEIKQDYNAGSAIQFGSTTQNIGGTTTSLDYCIPGDTSYCASPVAEYNFEENTGTTAKDTSGNNNNGTFGTGNSAPTWTVGANNKGAGVNFDGSSNKYISLSNSLNIGLSSWTISGWVKIPSSVIGRVGNFLGNYPDSPNLNLEVYTSGEMRYYWNGEISELGSTNLKDSKWHYLTWIRDKNSNSGHMYIDGKLEKSFSGAGSDLNFTTPFLIGSDKRVSGLTWHGQIDHIKIYNYARTPAQIAYDYNKGAPVGWWKMDECQGSTINDSSGVGNTGVIVIGSSGTQNSIGTCQIGTSAAWTNGASGKVNSSINFDGVDDYINCGSNISTPNEITFSGWIKPSNVTLSTQSISAFSPTGQYNYWLYLDNKSIQIAAYHTTYPNLTIPNVIQTNSVWYHVAFTATKGGYIKVFINGIKVGEGSAGNTYTESGGITIGDLRPDRNLRFPGQIDDVRIYNYALTQEQIKQVYNGGAVNFN